MRDIIKYNGIYVGTSASVVGKAEAEGPLRAWFDMCDDDEYFGKDTWEKAESEMAHRTLNLLLAKAQLSPTDLDLLCGGDLLNQCVASSFGVKDMQIPFLGLYGACSTFTEAILCAATFIKAGTAQNAVAFASSHFCSAEKQYRFPLEYGGQRTPTSQNTVTGCGAVLLNGIGGKIAVKDGMVGRIIDGGITDVNNMGAAMAKSAADTLCRYFDASNISPDDFDIIATGDLGREGYEICCELLKDKIPALADKFTDCGMLIYDLDKQDVHCGGSGCGCSAVVTAGYLLDKLLTGEAKNILLLSTGALMNPNTVFQHQSIAGIAHAVHFAGGASA